MKKPRILTAGIAAVLSLPGTLGAVDRTYTGLGALEVWTDPANWDQGVPTTGTGDNIFVRWTGSITAPAIDAGVLRIAVGTPEVPASGFTFGPGTFNLGEIQVADFNNGPLPKPNRYGRAFINAGTTINTGNFFVGEWDGGTGHVLQSGGDVNINGQFRVGHWPQTDVGGGTTSTYTMNGGTITVNGDPADPFNEGLAGNVFLGIDSTGVFTINGGTFTAKGIALDNRAATGGEDTLELNGGTLNIGANGIGSQNALIPATYEVRLSGGTVRATANWSSNLEINLVSGGSGVVFNPNGNVVTLSGPLVGTGGLTNNGAGTLVLTGANTYSGGTQIPAGTLEVGNGGASGSLGAGPVVVGSSGILTIKRTGIVNVPGAFSGDGVLLVNSGTLQLANANATVGGSVENGATLAVAGTLGAITGNPGSILEAGVNGVGNFTASTLFLTQTSLRIAAGTSSTKFIVTAPNGLVVNGTTSIVLNPVGLTTGTYTLVDYAGTLGGDGFGSFSLVGLPSRAVGGLVNNAANTSVDLSITAIDYPKWDGATDGNWDGVTQNWRLVVGGGLTNYLNFDAVLFDDTASGTTNINVTEAFTPSAVTFNNSAKTYTLAGLGAITGTTSLVKQGDGRVVLATANTYTGTTTVTAGTLQVGDGVTGSISGTTVTVGANGTLELNLAAAYNIPTTGAGQVKTIGVNSFDIAAGVLTGNPLLSIAGAASQVIGMNDQPGFDGNILISGGTLRAVGAQALGSTVGGTVITNGGTLDVNNLDLGGEQVFIEGNGVGGAGAIVNNGTGTIFNLHRVTLTGNASVGGTGRWDIRSTGIPDELLDLAGFKLTKVGANQVSMVEVNVTDGDIDINAGTFSIEANSGVQGTGTITLNPGGTLGLWVNQPGRLTRNIVANGGAISELGSGQQATVNSNITLLANLDYFLNGANTVVNQIGNITESGEPRTLNVNGPGRLILLGTNNWTGGFNVNNGVLQVGNGGTTGTIGTGTSTVLGTLVMARSDGSILDGDINPVAPAGTMILVGGGAVSLANGTDIKVNQLHFGVNGQNDTIGGTLNIGPGNSVVVEQAFINGNSGGAGGPVVGIINQTGGSLDVNAPNTDGRNFVLGHWAQGQGTYNQSAGILSSPNISMAISWDGSGTYNLSGGTANVLGLRFGHNAGQTGVFNLTGGTLNLGAEGLWAENAAAPTDVNLGGGAIRAITNTSIVVPIELTGTNGNTVFDTNGSTLNVNGNISGVGGFTKTGAGRMVLNAVNTAGGLFVVNGGTLAAIGTQAGNRIPDNAIVQINSGAAFEFGATNPASYFANYVVNEGGTLTNAATVEHAHVGTVQLAGGIWTTDAASGNFDGENYFLHTGVTVTGTTQSLITQQGGTSVDRGIAWQGTVTFDVADATGSESSDLLVLTELEDSGAPVAALVKAGGGTLDLLFANTYSGGTTVNAGTVLANNSSGSASGSGNITVAAGARIGGGGTFGNGAGAISVVVSGKIAPGNGAGALTFHLGAGTLDLIDAVGATGTGALEFELGAASDVIQFTSGTLDIGSGVLEFDDFAFTLGAGFGMGDYLLFDTTQPISGTLGTDLSGDLPGGFLGTLELVDGTNDIRLHVVPEPGTVTTLLGGLALLCARRRRGGSRG